MDINDYNSMEKTGKTRNWGYFYGFLMLSIAAILTLIIIYVCLGELKTEFSNIFSQSGLLKSAEKLFSFFTNIKKSLNFSKLMTALYYFDIFCILASVLGFVQGAFFKKHTTI